MTTINPIFNDQNDLIKMRLQPGQVLMCKGEGLNCKFKIVDAKDVPFFTLYKTSLPAVAKKVAAFADAMMRTPRGKITLQAHLHLRCNIIFLEKISNKHNRKYINEKQVDISCYSNDLIKYGMSSELIHLFRKEGEKKEELSYQLMSDGLEFLATEIIVRTNGKHDGIDYRGLGQFAHKALDSALMHKDKLTSEDRANFIKISIALQPLGESLYLPGGFSARRDGDFVRDLIDHLIEFPNNQACIYGYTRALLKFGAKFFFASKEQFMDTCKIINSLRKLGVSDDVLKRDILDESSALKMLKIYERNRKKIPKFISLLNTKDAHNLELFGKREKLCSDIIGSIAQFLEDTVPSRDFYTFLNEAVAEHVRKRQALREQELKSDKGKKLNKINCQDG